MVTEEYAITEQFNSLGVRGPEYDMEKKAGAYRILVMGDSFAEGISVEFEDLFSEVVQDRLNERGDQQVEVINLGVAGYSTDQELLLFQTEGKRYQPDLTVLVVYDNDIWFNGQSYYYIGGVDRGHKPLFSLEGGRLTLTQEQVPPPTSWVRKLSAGMPHQEDASVGRKIKFFLAEHSHLYRMIRTRVKNTAFLYQWAIDLGIADPIGNGDTIPIPEQFGIYRTTYSPDTRKAWTITEALLAQFQKEARALESELLVMHAPFGGTVDSTIWERYRRNYGVSEEEWSRDQVNQELAAITRRLGIDFLNPVPFMRARHRVLAEKGQKLYYEKDIHWNPEGNHVIGQILGDYISERYLNRSNGPRAEG